MSWRLAYSLVRFREEANRLWPNRSTISDGTIGDQAHASTGEASDHNPFIHDSTGQPVVRAFDLTADGVPAQHIADYLRTKGAAGDPRLAAGTWNGKTFTGYVIYNQQIAGPWTGWAWSPYHGPDPHTSHIHISVSPTQEGYDSTIPWGLDSLENDMITDQDKKDIAKLCVDEWISRVGQDPTPHTPGYTLTWLIGQIKQAVIDAEKATS